MALQSASSVKNTDTKATEYITKPKAKVEYEPKEAGKTNSQPKATTEAIEELNSTESKEMLEALNSAEYDYEDWLTEPDEDIEEVEDKEEDDIEDKKAKILNEDGTTNFENVEKMYSNGEITFDELAKLYGATPEETESGKKYFVTEDGTKYTMGKSKHETGKIEGADTSFKYDYEDVLNVYDSKGNRILEATTPESRAKRDEALREYTAEYGDIQKEYQERFKNLKEECFNENGSLKIDAVKNNIESGKMTVGDFIKICGKEITNASETGNFDYEGAHIKYCANELDSVTGAYIEIVVGNDTIRINQSVPETEDK